MEPLNQNYRIKMTNLEIIEILNPLIGQCVKKATQGYGSFINIEIDENSTFFIYMSNWKIIKNQTELAHDESTREQIERALNFITGKTFKEIILRSEQNTTELHFDNDYRIIISNENYNDDINEMWNFYTKSDYVLTFRNDHKIAFEKSNTQFGKSIFKNVSGELNIVGI